MAEQNPLYQQLDRIENTLDRIVPELAAIKADLSYHIRRSDLLEKKIEILEKDFNQWHGFFSIGGWLIAVIVSVFSILHSLKLI